MDIRAKYLITFFLVLALGLRTQEYFLDHIDANPKQESICLFSTEDLTPEERQEACREYAIEYYNDSQLIYLRNK